MFKFSKQERHVIYELALEEAEESINLGMGLCYACRRVVKRICPPSKQISPIEWYGDLFPEIYLFKNGDLDIFWGRGMETFTERIIALQICFELTK